MSADRKGTQMKRANESERGVACHGGALIRCIRWLGNFITLGLAKGTRPNRRRGLSSGTTLWTRIMWRLDPIPVAQFWIPLYYQVILGRHDGRSKPCTRLTNLVRLLDPLAMAVWPHPRKLYDASCGTVLAHLILRLRAPRLEVREVPGLGGQASEQTLREFAAEIEWRDQMFRSYGDKWPDGFIFPPNDQVERPAPVSRAPDASEAHESRKSSETHRRWSRFARTHGWVLSCSFNWPAIESPGKIQLPLKIKLRRLSCAVELRVRLLRHNAKVVNRWSAAVAYKARG
jgi:hypothetical protein